MDMRPKTALALHSFCAGGNLVFFFIGCMEHRVATAMVGLVFGVYSTVMMVRAYKNIF